MFGQPQNQAKVNFEKRLTDSIRSLQQRNIPGVGGNSEAIAKNVTDLINGVRKQKAFGFLPDNQHWRLLEEYLGKERFVASVASGYWTPKFVALATKEDLEMRMSAITGVSEDDFMAQIGTRMNTPDPSV